MRTTRIFQSVPSHPHCARAPQKARVFLTPAIVFSLLCGACSDYEFRFNDTLVYTPQPLFTDFRTVDAALFDCLTQTIQDKKIVQAEDLQNLSCNHAGIESLSGLETFSQLELLHLNHNKVSTIHPLLDLDKLREVDLSKNRLEDVTALTNLPRLERVDLRGNPDLICPQTPGARSRTFISLPDHCNSGG